MGKHRRNISIDKNVEERMLQEAKNLNLTFSTFIEKCFEHYQNTDIVSKLFKPRKK